MRGPGEAVHARVHAAAVRVDRPVERHRVARDLVDDRLRLDLDALDPAELGRVEGPPGDLEELLLRHRDRVEHVFDSVSPPFDRVEQPQVGTSVAWRPSSLRPTAGSTTSPATTRPRSRTGRS